MKPRINCLGVLVVDALSGPLARYPEPRVQIQVVTESIRFAPGGGAANTSGALARMGLPVAVFSKVGDDPNGAFLLRELGQLGVNTAGIRVSHTDSTPFTFVGIHPAGGGLEPARTFIHTPGANKTFCIDDLDRERLFDADFLLYQDLWVLPRLDGPTAAGLLAEAQRRGVVTLLDECWGLGPNRETFEAMLPHCDFALPSLEDVQVIYPGKSADDVAGHILACGAKAAILKMGAEGCLIARGTEKVRVPAFRVEVVDTTGAGDCWNAGFIAGLANGEAVHSAARLGNACSAFCIQAVGGCTGVPGYAAVRDLAQTL